MTASLASLIGRRESQVVEFNEGTLTAACPADAQSDDFTSLSLAYVPTRALEPDTDRPVPTDTNYKWKRANFGEKAYVPIFNQIAADNNLMPQVEESIAADQDVPGALVAAISDFSEITKSRPNLAYAVSTDDGKDWSTRLLPRKDGYFRNRDGIIWKAANDPTLAIDRQTHNVYLASLFEDGKLQAEQKTTFYNRGVYVSVQLFGNLAKGKEGFVGNKTYAVVTYSPPKKKWPDKPGIAVDNGYPNSSCKGNVYAAWLNVVEGATKNSGTASVQFSMSTNQGQTWSVPIDITGAFKRPDKVPNGVQVTVGPAEKDKPAPVYIAYDLQMPGTQDKSAKDGQIIVHTSSNCDAGEKMTFDKGESVTGKETFSDLLFLNFKDANYILDSWPSLAVSPKTGTVAVVWPVCTVPAPNQRRNECDGGDGTEILFSARKATAGATFSIPVIINDISQGQQFFPALAIDACGTFHVSWLDTRGKDGSVLRPNVYPTYTKNDGATFSDNFQVNMTPIKLSKAYTRIGDYTGIAARDGHAYPVWNNGGIQVPGFAGDGNLQTRTIMLPK
jgi:hypothetical protein